MFAAKKSRTQVCPSSAEHIWVQLQTTRSADDVDLDFANICDCRSGITLLDATGSIWQQHSVVYELCQDAGVSRVVCCRHSS